MAEEIVGFNRQDANALLSLITGTPSISRPEVEQSIETDWTGFATVKADIVSNGSGTVTLIERDGASWSTVTNQAGDDVEIDQVVNPSSRTLLAGIRVALIRENIQHDLIAIRPSVGLFIDALTLKLEFFDGTFEEIDLRTCGSSGGGGGGVNPEEETP